LGFGLLAFIILHHVGKTTPSSCANRVEGKPREKSLALCDRVVSEKCYTASLAVLIRHDVRFGSLADVSHYNRYVWAAIRVAIASEACRSGSLSRCADRAVVAV
jgi:hypothetical protein